MKTIEGSSKVLSSYKKDILLMTFKDDIHGANKTSNIKGTGTLRKEFTYHFYRYLEVKGIFTHLDSKTDAGLLVYECRPLKIEILVRNIARGHWVDEHKIPLIEGGTPFSNPLIEFCVKKKITLNNGSIIDDPRVNEDLMIELNTMAKDPEIKGHMPSNVKQVQMIKQLALSINDHYSRFLKSQGWMLEDFKFEVGLKNDQILLIDEISPDCSRIRDEKGNSLTKDLFRESKTQEEIYQSYETLAKAIAYESDQKESLCAR